MIYQRNIYRLNPEQYEPFTQFFHEYILPNQLGHGARLIGRYTTLDRDEVTSIWEYDSYEDYERIEETLKKSELYKEAQKRKKELGTLFNEKKQDFIEATGEYHFTKHIVSVSAYITNEKGEVLLVKNEHRNDTYEMPGGRMESGESLEEAIRREVLEETGVEIKVTGVTGVYHNITRGILCLVFKGEYESGELRTQPGETQDVIFQDLDQVKLDELVTREHFEVRISDARENEGVAIESYYVRPYEIIHRLEN